MGWRTTAQNLNLNRDYVKAEAPEMHAMLRLLEEWDPILLADLHVTDGADFEHDVSVDVAPTLAGDDELRQAAGGLRDELIRRLTAQGSLPLNFYPSFVRNAYSREPSPVSGALRTRYDPTRPQVWTVPLRDEVRPAVTVVAPRGGYIVPPAHASWIREKLGLHGIEARTVETTVRAAAVQTFRAVTSSIAPATFEGRAVRSLDGDWKDELRDVPAGSLYVPIAQPKSHLVMTMFEPKEPDSLVRWGFFNAAFEPRSTWRRTWRRKWVPGC